MPFRREVYGLFRIVGIPIRVSYAGVNRFESKGIRSQATMIQPHMSLVALLWYSFVDSQHRGLRTTGR